MAVMYPRTLFEPDLKSRAEGKVFDALEERLDDEWEVFHSVSGIIPRQGGASRTTRWTSCSSTPSAGSCPSR